MASEISASVSTVDLIAGNSTLMTPSTPTTTFKPITLCGAEEENTNSSNIVGLGSPSPVLSAFVNQQQQRNSDPLAKNRATRTPTPSQRLLFSDDKTSSSPSVAVIARTASKTDCALLFQSSTTADSTPFATFRTPAPIISTIVEVIDTSNVVIDLSDSQDTVGNNATGEVDTIGALETEAPASPEPTNTAPPVVTSAERRRREDEESERLAWQLMEQENIEAYNAQMQFIQQNSEGEPLSLNIVGVVDKNAQLSL
jgi:hypothetical protein